MLNYEHTKPPDSEQTPLTHQVLARASNRRGLGGLPYQARGWREAHYNVLTTCNSGYHRAPKFLSPALQVHHLQTIGQSEFGLL